MFCCCCCSLIGIQPVLQRNPALSTLGPGTLIMPDGRLVPVPAAPTMLATATQIIVNKPPSQPAVILMQNLPPVKTVSRNQLRPIVPKPRKRDITKTTYVNKVPIPAIRTNIISCCTTSNKVDCNKDNKKINEKKKVVLRKENMKNKTVSSETSKELDKGVGSTLSKDNTRLETRVPEQNLQIKKVTDEVNLTSKPDESKLCDEANLTKANSDTVKRKILDKEDKTNESSKRVKVTESTDSDKHNLVPSPVIPVSCCNNSNKLEHFKNVEKESNQKLENHERYSINALCTQETEKTSNLEPSTKSHSLTDKANENPLTTASNTALQEVESSTNQNGTPNKKNIEENAKDNEIQRLEISTQVKLVDCVEAKKQCSEMPHENDMGHKKNIEDLKSKHNENNCIAIMNSNNEPNKLVDVGINCTGNMKHSSESRNVQSFDQNTVKNDAIKKSNDSTIKSNHENKLIIHDDSQELTSLFPSDPKLQSCSENIFRDTDFRERNLFVPISHSYMDEVRLSLPHSDFSNDLFSSLQVPTGGQHPESISPTAAFLLAFPLVSTSKTSELIAETEASESQHATPTTILQIGNIEPPSTDPYHQNLMIESSVPGLQGSIKMTKSDESAKSNPLTKQHKNASHFDKFQQLEMNELLRNESFTKNNCGKEKKHFSELQEQDIYMPCNKKKQNGRNCDYSVPSEIIPNYHDKAFEYSSNSMRQDTVQNISVGQVRHTASNSNQKKIDVNPENLMDSHNSYNPSSQPYSYVGSGFSNGNDFSLSSSNYSASNRAANDSSKSLQVSSNFNVITWSTSSVTATTNHTDYSTSYCPIPQKPFINPPNKSLPQKVHQGSYDDQVMKEKSTPSNHPLPKFSANFQFNNNVNINNSSHSSQDVHGYSNANHTENINYKLDSKTKKTKSNSQRPPVNWMTTPVVRPTLPNSNILSGLSDTFQPQKDLDFNSTSNNVLLSTANNIAPFNISSSVSNNPQTFYTNSHFTGIDFQLDFGSFPEINSSNKTTRTMSSSSQQNPHHYSWSPSKSSVPLLPHLETNMIPSTLPTLVGDLALGTSTPSGPVDAFRTLSMPTTPFNADTVGKKADIKHDTQKQAIRKSPDKDGFTSSERRNSNRNITDYCQKTHSHQSTNTTSSFLSVSQLVDQVKSEQGPSRRGGKQTVLNKNNASIQKRHNSHPTDKINQSKLSSNLNSSNSFQTSNTIHPGSINQRKHEVHPGYQENQNGCVGFPGGFGAPAPPWQQNKIHRSSAHYKGSYSAESLIGDLPAAPGQDNIAELPPFSVANQFSSQYNHTPVVSAAGYSGHELSHQNIQPLEFHQNSHQNCFNFPGQNSHYSASFNPENDFHLGLDPLYSFNSSNSRNTSCQTSIHSKDNRSSHKRLQGSKRREEFPPSHFMQTTQNYPRSKSSLPSTSSPSHPGTTSLTNFNLSTIFPEINDKASTIVKLTHNKILFIIRFYIMLRIDSSSCCCFII